MTLYNFRDYTHIRVNTGQDNMFMQSAPVFSPFASFFGAMMMRMSNCFNPYIQSSSYNPFLSMGGQSGIYYNQINMPVFSNTPYIPTTATPTYTNNFLYNTPSYQSLTYGVGDYFVPRTNSSFTSNSFSLSNSYVGSYVPTSNPSSVASNTPVSTVNTRYGKKDLNFWRNLGYNEEKGRQLVENAKHSRYRGARHQCVAVVRESINETYYGGQLHYAQFGKACDIGDSFLSHDSHFKKIIPDWDVSPEDFPPGAIIVYRGDNGSGGYVRGDNRGHGEIAYGDGSGKGISNYDLSIKPQYIKEVWIPV